MKEWFNGYTYEIDTTILTDDEKKKLIRIIIDDNLGAGNWCINDNTVIISNNIFKDIELHLRLEKLLGEIEERLESKKYDINDELKNIEKIEAIEF